MRVKFEKVSFTEVVHLNQKVFETEKKINLPTSPGPLAQTCLLEQPGTLTDPKVQEEEEEEEEKVSWSEQSGM